MSRENIKENNESFVSNGMDDVESNESFVSNERDNEEKRHVNDMSDYSSCGHLGDNDKRDDDGLGDVGEIEFFDDCDYLDLLEDFEIEDLESDKYCKNSRDSNPLMKLPNPFSENDLNELALLGFFNDFTLVDVGLHDFIREVYFEE